MSEEEAINHLGTIAKSGSKDFMSEVQESDSASAQSIIGQFGVGFYSVFMVADQVDVFTRRWDAETGIHWSSDGQGGYTVKPIEGLSVGTQIELKLRTDCREYSDVEEVKRVATKYSSFTSFPLMCDNEQVNNIEPIWMLEKNKITDEMHNSFYQFLTGEPGAFRFNLYYKTEMPISVRSIFYIPKDRPSMMSADDRKSEISLYCRKVLISNKTDMILPSWMRFIKGVVDSEDIPLNLSRELLQNTTLISKIRETLTDRLIKFLNDRARIEPEEYRQFYNEYKVFIAEGIATEEAAHRRDEMAKLLRYESSNLPAGQMTSLSTYLENMKENQRYIFFLPANNRAQAENSPYLEAIKNKGYEVLFMYDPFDEVVMERMMRFKDKTPFSIENDIIDDDVNAESMEDQMKDDSVPSEDFAKLSSWSKEILGDLVKDVSMTSKLDRQPAMVTVWNLGVVRQFIKMEKMRNPDKAGNLYNEEQLAQIVEPKLQLSSSHPVTKKLITLHESDPELAEQILKQLYHAAMANAGLNDDAVSIANKTNNLVEMFLEKL
jgi:TNF receptor-associated protein 1